MNGQFPLGDIHPIRYFFGISIGLGLLFAFITPDSNHPFWLTLVQWQLQTSLPMGLLVLSHLLLAKARFFARLNVWKQVALSGMLGASLFVPAALCIDIYIMGEGIPKDLKSELINEWFGVTPPVTITWVLINIPWLMGFQYQKILANPSNKNDKALGNAIFPIDNESSVTALLPTDLRAQILFISSELHYLKIVTKNGKSLILGSLKEAMLELSKDQGMQIHRSHWVSYSAIERYVKDGRQGKLILVNGDTMPVSRSFNESVKVKLGV
jgi:hypothetical protein